MADAMEKNRMLDLHDEAMAKDAALIDRFLAEKDKDGAKLEFVLSRQTLMLELLFSVIRELADSKE
jgi:hypothetical protein